MCLLLYWFKNHVQSINIHNAASDRSGECAGATTDLTGSCQMYNAKTGAPVLVHSLRKHYYALHESYGRVIQS